MKLTKQRRREMNATYIQRPLVILHSLVWAFETLYDSADEEHTEMRAALGKLMAPGTDALAAGLGSCSCWIRKAMLSDFSVNRCSIYRWLAATMPGHRLVDLKLLQQATLLSQADCDLLATWGEHSLETLAPSHPFTRWFKFEQLELAFHHMVMETLRRANILHLSGFVHSDYTPASPLQMPPCICLSPALLLALLPPSTPQMNCPADSSQHGTAHVAATNDVSSKADITAGIKQHFLKDVAALDKSIAAGSKVRLGIEREPSATDLIPTGHDQAGEPYCVNDDFNMNNRGGPAAADAAQAEVVAPTQSFTFPYTCAHQSEPGGRVKVTSLEDVFELDWVKERAAEFQQPAGQEEDVQQASKEEVVQAPHQARALQQQDTGDEISWKQTMLCILLALGFFATLIFSVAVPIRLAINPSSLDSPLHQDHAPLLTAGLNIDPITASYNVTSLVAAPYREASVEADVSVDDLWRAPGQEQTAADAVDLSDRSQGTDLATETSIDSLGVQPASKGILAADVDQICMSESQTGELVDASVEVTLADMPAKSAAMQQYLINDITNPAGSAISLQAKPTSGSMEQFHTDAPIPPTSTEIASAAATVLSSTFDIPATAHIAPTNAPATAQIAPTVTPATLEVAPTNIPATAQVAPTSIPATAQSAPIDTPAIAQTAPTNPIIDHISNAMSTITWHPPHSSPHPLGLRTPPLPGSAMSPVPTSGPQQANAAKFAPTIKAIIIAAASEASDLVLSTAATHTNPTSPVSATLSMGTATPLARATASSHDIRLSATADMVSTADSMLIDIDSMYKSLTAFASNAYLGSNSQWAEVQKAALVHGLQYTTAVAVYSDFPGGGWRTISGRTVALSHSCATAAPAVEALVPVNLLEGLLGAGARDLNQICSSTHSPALSTAIAIWHAKLSDTPSVTKFPAPHAMLELVPKQVVGVVSFWHVPAATPTLMCLPANAVGSRGGQAAQRSPSTQLSDSISVRKLQPTCDTVSTDVPLISAVSLHSSDTGAQPPSSLLQKQQNAPASLMQLTFNLASPVTPIAKQYMLSQLPSDVPRKSERIHGSYHTAQPTMTELHAQIAEVQTQLGYLQHKMSLIVEENNHWRVLYAELARFQVGAHLGG